MTGELTSSLGGEESLTRLSADWVAVTFALEVARVSRAGVSRGLEESDKDNLRFRVFEDAVVGCLAKMTVRVRADQADRWWLANRGYGVASSLT